MLRIFTPTNQTYRGTVSLLQVAKRFWRKLRLVLLFATKSIHFARFTGWELSPVYGVTPGYCCPISCQYLCNWQQPDLLQDGFDQTRNIAFNTYCSNAPKQVARFCCPCYRTLHRVSSENRIRRSIHDIPKFNHPPLTTIDLFFKYCVKFLKKSNKTWKRRQISII